MRRDQKLDFLVIGAQKCGTTSIHRHLSAHPDLFLPAEKEIPFFSEDDSYASGFDAYFDEFFATADDKLLIGTVTPQYMMSPVAPERIYAHNSNAKIVAILRDPIDRAYSHYRMATRSNGETRTFDEAVRMQITGSYLEKARKHPDYWRDYVHFGEYGRLLRPYFELFGKQNVLVLRTEDLGSAPDEVIGRLLTFLEVGFFEIPTLGTHYNKASSSTMRTLVSNIVLASRIRRLGKLLPRKLRRRVRLSLASHRNTSPDDIDMSPHLSSTSRRAVQSLYLEDAKILGQLTEVEPRWIRSWR